MMHISLLAPAIFLAVVALRQVAIFIQRARGPLSQVPGPWHTKWTSAVVTYHWLRGRRAHYVQQLHEKYGRVVRVGPHDVDFSSVSAVKRIHAFNKPFPKGQMYNMFRSGNGSHNIFSTQDPDFHSRHRRLLSAPISEGGLRAFEDTVKGRVDLAIEKMGLDMKRNGVVNVMDWWMFFSTDVIGELTFGDSFRMLEQGRVNDYAKDLKSVAQRSGVRVAFPRLFQMGSFLPLPYFTDAYAATQRMRSYAEESVRRYERIVAAEPNNPKPTLFTRLFQADGDKMSKPEIVAASQTYITAGSDTTAHSLTYLTWAVCRDPSIKARLVEELSALPDDYKEEDLKTLPYLNQVIYETLRVYGAAPALLPRAIPPTGCDIDGYWMPGGTEVQTQAYSVHRDPEVFPDPERFDPSRWESPTKDMKDAWMPFGGGARICIGLHLAQMELRLATTKFFRAYPNARVSTRDGFCDDDMDSYIYFLMYPKNKRCLIELS